MNKRSYNFLISMSKNLELFQETSLARSQLQNQGRNGVKNVTFALKNPKLIQIYPSARYGTQDTLSDVEIVQIQGQDGDEQDQLDSLKVIPRQSNQLNTEQNLIQREKQEYQQSSQEQKNKNSNNFKIQANKINIIQKQQTENQLQLKYKYRNTTSNKDRRNDQRNQSRDEDVREDKEQQIQQKYNRILKQSRQKQQQIIALKEVNHKLAGIIKLRNRKYVNQIGSRGHQQEDQSDQEHKAKSSKLNQFRETLDKFATMINISADQRQQIWKGALWGIIVYLILMCIGSLGKR